MPRTYFKLVLVAAFAVATSGSSGAVSSTVMNGSFNTTHAVGKRWIEEEIPGSVVSTLTS